MRAALVRILVVDLKIAIEALKEGYYIVTSKRTSLGRIDRSRGVACTQGEEQ